LLSCHGIRYDKRIFLLFYILFIFLISVVVLLRCTLHLK
jgi:hypothetical protein